MTELEKAKCGKYEEIDFNALAREMAAENAAYTELCLRCAKAPGGISKNVKMKDHLEVGGRAVLALNAFLQAVGVHDGVVPQYVAALRNLAEIMLNLTDHLGNRTQAEGLADAFTEILRDSLTTVTVRAPMDDKK